MIKKFFDNWYYFVGMAIFILFVVICFALGYSLIYNRDLENDLKRYQDFYECVKSGVDYVVCEIHFIK